LNNLNVSHVMSKGTSKKPFFEGHIHYLQMLAISALIFQISSWLRTVADCQGDLTVKLRALYTLNAERGAPRQN